MAELYRVTTEFGDITGAPYYSTFHMDLGSLQDAGTAVAVSKQFWDGCASAIDSDVSCTILGDVDVIESTTGQIVRVETTANATSSPSALGEVLPLSTQGLVSWATGVYTGGRQIRGRTYIPAPIDNANDNGVPSGPYITDLQNAADAMVGTGLVIYSDTYKSFAPVSGAQVRSYWATLRSRRA